MEADAGVVLQKRPNGRGLVSGEIVENDVDLLAGRAKVNDFVEKRDEFLAGVTCGSFSMNPTSGRIQRCIQGERCASVVFKSVSFDAAGGKGQN